MKDDLGDFGGIIQSSEFKGRSTPRPSDVIFWTAFSGLWIVTIFLGYHAHKSAQFHGIDPQSFHVETGMTMDQVRARYGPPHEQCRSSQYHIAGGKLIWIYYANYLDTGGRTVVFDDNDRVQTWLYD